MKDNNWKIFIEVNKIILFKASPVRDITRFDIQFPPGYLPLIPNSRCLVIDIFTISVHGYIYRFANTVGEMLKRSIHIITGFFVAFAGICILIVPWNAPFSKQRKGEGFRVFYIVVSGQILSVIEGVYCPIRTIKI